MRSSVVEPVECEHAAFVVELLGLLAPAAQLALHDAMNGEPVATIRDGESGELLCNHTAQSAGRSGRIRRGLYSWLRPDVIGTRAAHHPGTAMIATATPTTI